jgi:glycosyltransferase involved in cell wall biosynthesis
MFAPPLVTASFTAEGIRAAPVPPRVPAPKPWRIMLLVSNLWTGGGAEGQFIELALRLKARGWDLCVASVLPPGGGEVVLSAHGIPVRTLGVSRSSQLPASILRLRRHIREQKPHILHAHMTHAALLARVVRLVEPIPVVIGTLHGLKMYKDSGTGWRGREFLGALTRWLPDATTVVCDAAARHCVAARTALPRKLRVVPNGIDTGTFRADPAVRSATRRSLGIAHEFVWVLAGRFQPVKDHCTLLRAFVQVLERHPDSLLLLAGDGPLQGEMVELAQALGIAAKVRFAGVRDDMPALLNAADVCVLSSVYEALSMFLLEGAATGLPAVATDVGGNGDIVLDGVTGFLAPAGDPNALAQAMLRMARLPEHERHAMGARARAHIQAQYSIDSVVDHWESLYQELLERRGVRP